MMFVLTAPTTSASRRGAPHLSGITEQGEPSGTTADATYWSPTVASIAGQVSSTLNDLETWGHALFTGEGILTPEMQQVRRDSRPNPASYIEAAMAEILAAQ